MTNLMAIARNNLENDREELDTLIETVRRDGRTSLKASEQRRFERLETSITENQEAVAKLERDEKYGKSAAAAAKRFFPSEGVSVGSEARTYRPDGQNSYFRDLATASIYNDADARGRLERHVQEIGMETRVNGSRIDGAGGYFVAPRWLMDEYISLARPARPFADACHKLPLPIGTDTINIPKIATGSQIAVQSTDGAPIASTDATDTFVTSPVITLAGQSDVSMQLIEQSPAGFDKVIFSDLARAYATQLDIQTLTGAGTIGQVTGALTMSGSSVVTYTDGTPTVPELYPKLADAIRSVHSNLFLPPTHIWMHPRRWAWCLSALDSSNRPLVVPNAQGPYNSLGAETNVDSEGGPVGTIQGVSVFVDASIPTNLGAGANEDRIIVTRMDQLYLFEGELRTRAMQEVLSGTLQVRLQAYNYVAYIANRLPAAVAIIAGTGLVTPTF